MLKKDDLNSISSCLEMKKKNLTLFNALSRTLKKVALYSVYWLAPRRYVLDFLESIKAVRFVSTNDRWKVLWTRKGERICGRGTIVWRILQLVNHWIASGQSIHRMVQSKRELRDDGPPIRLQSFCEWTGPRLYRCNALIMVKERLSIRLFFFLLVLFKRFVMKSRINLHLVTTAFKVFSGFASIISWMSRCR